MNKGQVTLFILLGILILAGAGLLVYLISGDDGVTIEDSTAQSKNRISLFIDSCVEPTTYEGLEIMRMRGGWINIPIGVPVTVVSDNVAILESATGPYLSDVPGLNEVPHWHIGNSPYIPTLEKMQSDMETYIEDRLDGCLDDFSVFVDEGFSVEVGSLEVNVSFDQATIVDVLIPVNATRDEESISIERTSVTLPINMRKLHETGLDLTFQELEGYYLEDHLKTLISHYGFAGVENDEYTIPPFFVPVTGTSCNVQRWNIDTTEERFKTILGDTMYLLRVANTNYDDVLISPGFSRASCQTATPSEECVGQGALDSYIQPIIGADDQIRVVHRYNPSWGLNGFDIKPRSGNIIEPDTHEIKGVAMLNLLCYMRYAFKYTVQAPILVEVNDLWTDQTEIPLGNPDNDFTFRFFLETDLQGNQFRVNTGRPTYITQLEDINGGSLDDSTFCNHPNSGIISTKVEDQENNVIEGASVRYRCGPSENICYLGRTDENGWASGRLPYCSNGEISASKGDFIDAYETLTIGDGQDRQFSLSMHPLRELDVEAKLLHLPTLMEGWFYTDGYTESTCAGETAVAVFNSAVMDLGFPDDQVFVGLVHARNSLTPILNFNESGIGTSAVLGPGRYDVSFSYSSTVTIEPSFLDTGDGNTQELSLNRNGGPRTGIYPLGDAQMSWDFDGSGDKVTFYIPTNKIPTERIEASDLSDFIIQGNELIYTVENIAAGSSVRHGCSNPAIGSVPLRVVERRWRDIVGPLIE